MYTKSLLVLNVCITFLVLTLNAQIPSPGPVRATLRDLVVGTGAVNVTTEFYRLRGRDRWQLIATQQTNPTGSINTLIHPSNFTYTNYKFVFYTEEYYKARGFETFYPIIEIIFAKRDENVHLIPVSMSPYGYSAYRGVAPT